MAGKWRPRDVSVEDAERFEPLWNEARDAVERVFSRAKYQEVDGMADWVWEKAYKAFGAALTLERKDRAAGREFGWVGWFVMVAINHLRDEKRREKNLAKKLGQRVRVEGRLQEVSRDGVREDYWREHADNRWSSVEERAQWAVLIQVLQGLLDTRPLLDQGVLLAWVEVPSDAHVARELGISAPAARGRRLRSMAWLKVELERLGYTAQNRPRLPTSNAWGFPTGWGSATVRRLVGRARAA